MFWRKEKEKGKRSLEDMFAPIDEGDSSVDEAEIDCEETAEIADEKKEAKNEVIKPLDFFGMEEGKTDKWLIKCVKFWYCFMSFVWFLIGALTFAPVLYISNKVNVIFNDKKKSLLCATVIHGLLLALLIIFVFVK